jgi:hypothetical protein
MADKMRVIFEQVSLLVGKNLCHHSGDAGRDVFDHRQRLRAGLGMRTMRSDYLVTHDHGHHTSPNVESFGESKDTANLLELPTEKLEGQ